MVYVTPPPQTIFKVTGQQLWVHTLGGVFHVCYTDDKDLALRVDTSQADKWEQVIAQTSKVMIEREDIPAEQLPKTVSLMSAVTEG